MRASSSTQAGAQDIGARDIPITMLHARTAAFQPADAPSDSLLEIDTKETSTDESDTI